MATSTFSSVTAIATLLMLVIMELFVVLTILCDFYLVPWLTVLQKRLRLSDDAAGATLMALGAAAPELCIAMISAANSDPLQAMGVVCGTSMISIGLIPSLCFFALNKFKPRPCCCEQPSGEKSTPLKLERWPVIRDIATFACGLTFAMFVFTANPQTEVKLWQALVMIGLYVVYITVTLFVECFSDKPAAGSGQDSYHPDVAAAASGAGVPVPPPVTSPTLPPRRGYTDAEQPKKDEESTPLLPLLPGGGDRGNGMEQPLLLTETDRWYDSWRGTRDPARLLLKALLVRTIPRPPYSPYLYHIQYEDKSANTVEDMKVEEPSLCRTLLGLCTSFGWLVIFSQGVYLSVDEICNAVPFLSRMATGAVLLAFGAQLPDVIGCVSMVQAGCSKGAISASVSSQVIVVTLGFGLPWLSMLMCGRRVTLEDTRGERDMITYLALISLLISAIYLFATLYSGFRYGQPQITGKTAAVSLVTFTLGYIAFLVLEILGQIGDVK